MTKTQSIKLINQAWAYVGETLDNINMDHYGRQLLKVNMQEERGHRRFCPDGIRCGLTIPQSAKLFCVKHLADYLLGERLPTAKEFIHTRHSAFLAASLVANYPGEIRQAFEVADVKLTDLAALDYAVLNKDPRQ